MRRSHTYYIYSIVSGLVLLGALLSGCTRVDPVEPMDETSEGIVFTPEVTSTKGLLDAADLSTSGTKIKVYDYISNFDGEVGGATVTTSQTVKYFDAMIAYNGSAIWPYCNPSTGAIDATIAYPWTKKGTHTFFGWLDTDGKASGLSTSTLFTGSSPSAFGFNESTRVLSIPTTVMGESTPQFDFSYASPVSVDAATRTPGSSVSQTLQHLFTAFKITATNTSGNTILLKSVSLRGMKNSRSATIDFKTVPPTVSTANLSAVNIPLFTYDAPVNADPYGPVFVDLDEELDELMPNQFLLMWPQTYAELTDATLHVVYKVRVTTDGGDQDSDELEADIVLKNQPVFRTNSTGMDAGKKYIFNLQFKKSTLDIYTNVLPWEYEEFDWDYANRSISARSGMFKDGVLAFYRGTGESATEPTTDEWSAKTMRFISRNEVLTGRFYIEAPTLGRWSINAYPLSAARYFIIEPTSDDIDVYTDNGKAEFTVRVNPDLTPASTQTLYFSVSIYFNGEWHDANSEFNRKNIKLVLDAN